MRNNYFSEKEREENQKFFHEALLVKGIYAVCRHCDKETKWVEENKCWVCPHCGYQDDAPILRRG